MARSDSPPFGMIADVTDKLKSSYDFYIRLFSVHHTFSQDKGQNVESIVKTRGDVLIEREKHILVKLKRRVPFTHFTLIHTNHGYVLTCTKPCPSYGTTFVRYVSVLYRHVVGITMGTSCISLVTDLFLYTYKKKFLHNLTKNNNINNNGHTMIWNVFSVLWFILHLLLILCLTFMKLKSIPKVRMQTMITQKHYFWILISK